MFVGMRIYFYIVVLLVFCSCTKNFQVTFADWETTPVSNTDDAADDIAIYNLDDTYAIIGTNKQSGLVVYSHTGKLIKDYPVGRINNVDLRHNVLWNSESITIVGGSNRSTNSIDFFKVDPNTLALTSLHEQVILSSVNEVYGFCLYLGKKDILYAFVVGKDGVVEQWRLAPDEKNRLVANRERTFDVGGQCEGMVTDDQNGYLYIGEEEVGIWRYEAEPVEAHTRKNIADIKSNKLLKADIEGLAIYRSKQGQSAYLLASSQGNNSYAIFDINNDYHHISSFKIKAGKYGGVTDTDGIDVSAVPFGSCQDGVFIAQDGNNGKENQNFKIVNFDSIHSFLNQ